MACRALAFASLIVGVAHLRSPAGFSAITPSRVPSPALVVLLTGLPARSGS